MDLVLSNIPDRYYPLFLLLYHTGCRIGEALALEWDDINFISLTVTICKTAKDQTIKKSTKTYTARTIPLSDELSSILQQLQVLDKKECFADGIPQRYIFHTGSRILAENTVRRVWSRACKKTGVGHRTVHTIRHTCASLHLARGSGIERVSYLLGHSSPKITWDVYSHHLPSEDNDFINNLSNGKDKARYTPHTPPIRVKKAL